MHPRTLKEHQTTLRFTAGMWEELVAAADALDVSVAQYVRDAARARLEREAGKRSGRGPTPEETAS
jgi:hypothetical protein